MSQPTGLFSVRRPRETLGPIQNFSGIPQPMSAMKRISSSNDIRAPYTGQHARSTSIHSVQRPAQPNFHRSSSSGNLADLGASAVRRSTINPFSSTNMNGSGQAHRQSLAPNQLFGSQTPASASVQRRSSIYSRPSGAQALGLQNIFSAPVAPVKKVDPRAQMGKAYREQMSRELLEYLTQNNFELEMKHSLRPTATTSPTQNDFNLIFQWLYKRIDPSYKFQRAIEVELPQLIKQLRYPYGTDISKSHIYPITPQHWPKFLLMFHWMMQLALMLDNFLRGAYDDASAEAGVDVASDRIVFRFLFSAYQDWLQVSPDQDDEAADAALEPHRQAMAEEFDRINAKNEEELKIYEHEHDELQKQIAEIEAQMPDIAKLDKHFKILEDDKRKFEDYNNTVNNKIEKYSQRWQILEAEIAKTETDLTAVESERLSLQSAVDRQGLNIQDIDRMTSERDRLTKAHEEAVTSLGQMSRLVRDKEAETSHKLVDLESITKRYNTLAYQTSLIPSTSVNAKGQEYLLELQISEMANNFSISQQHEHYRSSRFSSSTPTSVTTDRLLSNPTTGYLPTHLLPSSIDLRGTIRPSLLSLRKTITDRRRLATDTALSDRDLIDSVSEVLAEKSTHLDTLSYKLTSTKSLYSQLKDDFSTSETQTLSKREKLELELGKMRDGLERGVLELEQREIEVMLAWEGMKSESERVREELHGGVERLLEDVVRFKLRIREGLEVFEGWVGEEVEKELEGRIEAEIEEDGEESEGKQ